MSLQMRSKLRRPMRASQKGLLHATIHLPASCMMRTHCRCQVLSMCAALQVASLQGQLATATSALHTAEAALRCAPIT